MTLNSRVISFYSRRQWASIRLWEHRWHVGTRRLLPSHWIHLFESCIIAIVIVTCAMNLTKQMRLDTYPFCVSSVSSVAAFSRAPIICIDRVCRKKTCLNSTTTYKLLTDFSHCLASTHLTIFSISLVRAFSRQRHFFYVNYHHLNAYDRDQ